ncbi:MAG: Do family serine endopeptidase [Acidiferrobacteraceae bacterium]
MRWRSAAIFIGQSIVLGLAVAFVILLAWPRLAPHRVVVIRRAPAPPATVTGPVSYAHAVQIAAPAVVNINTAAVTTYRPQPFLNDPFFRQFFGNLTGPPQKRLETSLGSGVIVSPSGYIMTNYHVIKGAQEIEVFLKDGRHAAARVIGTDPASDLAVLKINLPHLTAITFGNSEKLQVGDVVLAIGDPFGVGQTVTMGIVSATRRNELGLSPLDNFIQTDAAINPGNSGGALVNPEGDLVGINSAILSRSGGFQGIGFAIPVNHARHVFEQIIKYGHVIRGWLGIEAQTITPELAHALRLKSTAGVVVAGILQNGPASKAGLRPGDVILALNGHAINSADQALRSISRQRPGTSVVLKILRHGTPMTLTATAINRPLRLPPQAPLQ